MHLWLLGCSLDSRPGLRLTAAANAADGREKKKKEKDKGGGTRNLLSLPRDDKDDEWGDDNNEGATAEPILRVLHDQSCFVPGSMTILILVDRPLLDANGNW